MNEKDLPTVQLTMSNRNPTLDEGNDQGDVGAAGGGGAKNSRWKGGVFKKKTALHTPVTMRGHKHEWGGAGTKLKMVGETSVVERRESYLLLEKKMGGGKGRWGGIQVPEKSTVT